MVVFSSPKSRLGYLEDNIVKKKKQFFLSKGSWQLPLFISFPSLQGKPLVKCAFVTFPSVIQEKLP